MTQRNPASKKKTNKRILNLDHNSEETVCNRYYSFINCEISSKAEAKYLIDHTVSDYTLGRNKKVKNS